LSDLLAAVGVLAAAACAAVAILLPPGRLRAAAMLAALALFPLLILGDQWHSPQIVDLRHSPARLIGLAALALAASAALAYAFTRWPIVLPLAIVAVLPFRVPLHAGGDTANLLVPLYVVIAGGVLAVAARAGGAGGGVSRGRGVMFFAQITRREKGSPRRKTQQPEETPPPPPGPARQAVLAAFVALLVHTMAYAGFYEDPITWVLLAAAASLAAAAPVRRPA
jgi:hypothetical protein